MADDVFAEMETKGLEIRKRYLRLGFLLVAGSFIIKLVDFGLEKLVVHGAE